MHATTSRMEREYPLEMSAFRKLYSMISTHAGMIYPPDRQPNESRRRTRFILRSLLYLPLTMRWLSFLNSTQQIRLLTAAIPHIAETWHRPYLRTGLGANRRLAILFEHYRFLLGHPYGSALIAAIWQQLPIAKWQGKQGERFALYFDNHWGRKQEGEVVLKLTEDDVPIYTLAGTFLGTEGHIIFTLGCLQGPQRSLGNDRVKQTTKAMHAMRPRDLMFYCAQLVAEAFSVKSIVGIASSHHVYRSRTKTRYRVAPDYYDTLWKELGGTVRHDGDFELPLHIPYRPIEDYPSQRRAEARRRHALKDEIRDQIMAFLLASTAEIDSDQSTLVDVA